jgi:hypothetical protein
MTAGRSRDVPFPDCHGTPSPLLRELCAELADIDHAARAGRATLDLERLITTLSEPTQDGSGPVDQMLSYARALQAGGRSTVRRAS